MTSNRPIKFVASGFPSSADDFAEHALDLNKYLLKHPAASFYLKNQGDANRCYGIYDGDILLVDRSLEPSSRYLNLVVLDDELKVRGYKSFLNLSKSEKVDCELWGVISSVIRKF